MDFSSYQNKSMRTLPDREQKENLVMCCLGLIGEVGELVDLIKKVVYHDHEPDIKRISEEAGDVLWYLANTMNLFEIDFNAVAKGNIGKLLKRYPNGFDEERSRKRDRAN